MFSNVHFLSNFTILAINASDAILVLLFLLRAHKTGIFAEAALLLILSILAFSLFISTRADLLRLFLLIVAFRGIDPGEFIKFDLTLKLIILAVVLSLYFAGLTENFYIIEEGRRKRSSMGFFHPNYFGALLLSICMSIYYLKFYRLNIVYYALFTAAFLAIRNLANSRTSLYAIIMLCAIHILHLLSSGKLLANRAIRFLFYNSFIILTFASILLSFLYKAGNQYVVNLDKMFTGRIELMSRFLDFYGVSLFSTEIVEINWVTAIETGRHYWVLDNGYMMLLLRFGLLAFSLFAFAVRKTIRGLLNQKAYPGAIILFVFMVGGIMESYFYHIVINPFMFVLIAGKRTDPTREDGACTVPV